MEHFNESRDRTRRTLDSSSSGGFDPVRHGASPADSGRSAVADVSEELREQADALKSTDKTVLEYYRQRAYKIGEEAHGVSDAQQFNDAYNEWSKELPIAQIKFLHEWSTQDDSHPLNNRAYKAFARLVLGKIKL